jgi:RNA 2',3'-cyclic 3'-phosphodiesterase
MPRIFYALWPDARVRAALAAAGASIVLRNGRRVGEADLHLTLAFLGEVADDIADALSRQPGMSGVPPFAFEIARSGWWRRSGIVWLAPRDTPEPLAGLAGFLRGAAARQGLVSDTRAFSPHVSIARSVRLAPVDAPAVAVRWPVQDYVLACSSGTPAGGRYRVLHRWPLEP